MSCAILCPGQGPKLGAALDDIRDSEFFREWAPIVHDIADEEIFDAQKFSDSNHLRRNEVAALTAVFCGVYWAGELKGRGIEFAATAGYSVGQWTACSLAGLCDTQALLEIVWRRSLFMNQTPAVQTGRMLGVLGLKESEVERACAELTDEYAWIGISNYNCPGNLTVAGDAELIEAAGPVFMEMGAHKVVPLLNVAGAWHCPMLDEAAEAFSHYISDRTFGPANVPIIDNVTGGYLPNEAEKLKAALAAQINCAVRWDVGIQTMIDSGIDTFYEVGHGDMLSRMGLFITRKAKFLPTSRWHSA